MEVLPESRNHQGICKQICTFASCVNREPTCWETILIVFALKRKLLLQTKLLLLSPFGSELTPRLLGVNPITRCECHHPVWMPSLSVNAITQCEWDHLVWMPSLNLWMQSLSVNAITQCECHHSVWMRSLGVNAITRCECHHSVWMPSLGVNGIIRDCLNVLLCFHCSWRRWTWNGTRTAGSCRKRTKRRWMKSRAGPMRYKWRWRSKWRKRWKNWRLKSRTWRWVESNFSGRAAKSGAAEFSHVCRRCVGPHPPPPPWIGSPPLPAGHTWPQSRDLNFCETMNRLFSQENLRLTW